MFSKKYLVGALIGGTQLLLASSLFGAYSIGGGAYYQHTLGDIKNEDGFDENAISWVISYQQELSEFFTLEADLELAPDYGDTGDIYYQPQAYLLFGSWLYGGAGIGIGYLDGEWNDDPFYALRVGLNLPLTETLHIDLAANYRFEKISVLGDLDEDDADNITFGAYLRFQF